MTQEEYDRLLVESFYIRPDYKMWRICGFFNADVGGLKRIPAPDCMRLSVSVFICDYLPGIANVLWKRNKNDILKIAKAISKSNIDARRISANKTKNSRLKKERGKEVMQYQRFGKLTAEISKANDKCGGHEWHTVK